MGTFLRPGDGKEPDSIAYVQCAGSRDQTLGVEYCSRICCMYAIKQAMLLSGTLPLADITIYYMDIRTFGKGYEQFYQNAKAMGIQFVKGKVARITEDEAAQSGRARGIDRRGIGVVERTHDLVVLSVGLLPAWDPHPDFSGAGRGRWLYRHAPLRTFRPALRTSLVSSWPATAADRWTLWTVSCLPAPPPQKRLLIWRLQRCRIVAEEREAVHA